MQTSQIPSNADLAAELAAMTDASADAPPAKDPPAADPAADAEHDDAAVSADTGADVQADQPAADPPAEQEIKLDPAKAKRMAEASRAERQWKEKVAAERAAIKAEREKVDREIAEQRAEIEKGRAELAAFAKLKARVKYEPDEVLAALGADEADFELAARAAWARSTPGKADPAQRDAVLRAQREREQASRANAEIEAAKKEAAEARAEAVAVRKLIEERDQTAKREQAANAYLDEAAKVAAASTDAPLVARWLGKSPAKAREAMGTVALELLERDEVVPSHAEVVAEVERRERARLEDLGYDVATFLAAPAAAKKPTTPPSKTLERAGAGGTAPKPKLTGAALVDDIKRAVEMGKFDD